jgi:hypothetical protein
MGYLTDDPPIIDHPAGCGTGLLTATPCPPGARAGRT